MITKKHLNSIFFWAGFILFFPVRICIIVFYAIQKDFKEAEKLHNEIMLLIEEEKGKDV